MNIVNVTLTVSKEERRNIRVSAAMLDISISEYLRIAVAEKMERDNNER